MSLDNLHDVLVDTIKDLYNAEKQLIKALPKMAKAASSEDLQAAFEEHLEATEGHVSRLEKVFGELGLPVKGKTCHGMAGLIEEGKEAIDQKKSSNPAALDAALIAAAQKVEHYEISGYGSARTFAETLGLQSVANLLQQTLDEESEANEKLTTLAEGEINEAAAEEADEQDDDDEEFAGTASTSGRGRRNR